MVVLLLILNLNPLSLAFQFQAFSEAGTRKQLPLQGTYTLLQIDTFFCI